MTAERRFYRVSVVNRHTGAESIVEVEAESGDSALSRLASHDFIVGAVTLTRVESTQVSVETELRRISTQMSSLEIQMTRLLNARVVCSPYWTIARGILSFFGLVVLVAIVVVTAAFALVSLLALIAKNMP